MQDTTRTAFDICKVYADAMHICYMLDMFDEGDQYLDMIYRTLRDEHDPVLYASAQAVMLLDYCDEGQAVSEATVQLYDDSSMQAFADYLASRYAHYTWSVDVFMTCMSKVVRWMDINGEDDELCDLINTVFEDAVCIDDMVTFVASKEIISVATLL